jgi:miniconductance mechanosensitive channel
MKTIMFCNDSLLAKLSTLPSLKSSFENITAPLTNIGLFRTYVLEYLKQHPGTHKDYTAMVRYLQHAEIGLPMEIYVFTTSTELVTHEQVQSEIFDFIIASLPQFELKAGQRVSGN